MEVLKQEDVINTNRAHLPRLRVVAGFAAGFIGGTCTGFRAGSIMFLQGNIVKVFCENKSVKITRSEMQVYIWCHPTCGILTSCGVVAEVVSLYPALCFVGQSLAGLPHIHSCHPPTSSHSPTSPQYHPPSSSQ